MKHCETLGRTPRRLVGGLLLGACAVAIPTVVAAQTESAPSIEETVGWIQKKIAERPNPFKEVCDMPESFLGRRTCGHIDTSRLLSCSVSWTNTYIPDPYRAKLYSYEKRRQDEMAANLTLATGVALKDHDILVGLTFSGRSGFATQNGQRTTHPQADMLFENVDLARRMEKAFSRLIAICQSRAPKEPF